MARDKVFMGVDQYGNTYHGLIHPRKDLIDRTGKQHVSKMYVDNKAGESFHIGYVVGPFWVTLYEVSPVRIPA